MAADVKLLAMSDLHAGTRRYGRDEGGVNSRIRESIRALDWFCGLVESERPDLAAWVGDTTDTRRPGARELRAVADAAARISEACPLVVVGGNHDGPSTIGDDESHTLGWLQALRPRNVYVATTPSLFEVPTASGPVDVYCQPYPHPRSLDARAGGTIQERQAAVCDEVERRARFWSRRDEVDDPTLYLGHLSVAGARLGAERMMRAGWDATIPADALDGFDAAVLGHVHKRQQIGRAWYCGSPTATDWTEEGDAKGALLVEFGRDHPPAVTCLDFDARPVRTVDLRYVAGEETYWSPDGVAGTILRLRVRADRRPEAAWKARLEREAYAAGAHYVQVVVTVEEARQASVPASSAGPEERLRAWLRDRDQPEEPALTLAREIMR